MTWINHASRALSRPVLPASEAAAGVLSRAVVRAAEQLALTQARMARVLGLSTATASRLAGGDWQIARSSKTWELATVFLRIYRSLAAMTGTDSAAMRAWMHSHNDALGGEPAQLIVSAEGLIHVLHYLDAARGRN